MSSRIRALLIIGIAFGLMIPVMASAADRFTDVPDTSIFHDDISWLADAGVTLGCNPPTNDAFCPSDDVTREQMAAFIRRFARYIDAEDGTPARADDADKLGGADSTAYRTVASGQALSFLTAGTLVLPAGAATTMVETAISAPADGYLMITNTATVTSLATALVTGTWVQLDDTVCAGTALIPANHVAGTLVYSSAADKSDENAHAGSAVVAVSAGDHTLTYCGASDPSDTTTVWTANIMGLWTAEGAASVVAPSPASTAAGSAND